MDVPNAKARGEILKFCTRKLRENSRLDTCLDLGGLPFYAVDNRV